MSMDELLTMIVMLILMCCVIYKVQMYPDFNPGFFNIRNTNALRGIWSIVVIMVHIPVRYGNVLQDMVGSFAYIGVTFFFMFSGFGLSLGLMRTGTIQNGFWRKRLPKLLLPQLLLNIFSAFVTWVILGDTITISSIVRISKWVWWLLVCYLIFWFAHKLCPNKKWGNAVVALFVVGYSIGRYYLNHAGIVTTTIWPTEIYGFLWGILLASMFSRIQNAGNMHWFRNSALVCFAALLLGVMYLKFKTVVFWGDYLLKIVLGIAIVGFVLLLNTRISIGNKALDFLGNISYELYLSHSFVISLIRYGMPNVRSGVFILIVLTVSIILSAILHSISEFILKKITFISKNRR